MMKTTPSWVAALQQDLDELSEVFTTSTSITPALLPGERRAVAVLFLDLKGFTSMSEQLDHEVVHKITSTVMSGLSRLVEFHGGYVDKFEGDRIMALFGAEKAHENDCVRAVSCAIRMIDVVQEFGVLLRDRGLPIDARAGVSFGDVTVAPDPSGHITATGDKVNIASRMEEMAETGTVQVTGAVRDAAGGLFEWEDLGTISVKGKREAIHAYRPTGPGQAQIERWERAKRLTAIPFVGRREELAVLESILDKQSGAVRYNRRGGAKHIIVGVQGTAGIGKSRLIHEFRKSLEKSVDRAPILKAHCASYAQPPLWLILSLIRDWLGFGPAEYPSEKEVRSRLENLLCTQAAKTIPIREDSIGILTSLLSPCGRDASSSSSIESGDDGRLQALSSVSDLIRVLADSSDSLIVILDDIHWIDSASREAIEFLAANCDTKLPILFLLMYRPDPDLGREIMQGVPEEFASTEEIILGEIDAESSRELIRYLLGAEDSSVPAVSGKVVEFLLESSGGNAFFIEELVLSLTETGLLEQDEKGEWILSASPESIVIPGSVKGIIRTRTDQLPPRPRKLLQIASVLGEEFNPDVLFQVAVDTGMEGTADELFMELLERGFLAPDDDNPAVFRFEHVLAKDAVYETILKRNRRLVHSLCANALEEHEEHDQNLADAIARHRADAGEIEKAIPWGTRAQDLAVERYDRDAVLFWSDRLEQWIREGLDSEDDARFLVEVLFKRQESEGLNLAWEAQRETLRKIDDLVTEWNLQDLRARYLMALGNYHRRSINIEEANVAFEQALDLFRQAEDRSGIARAISGIGLCNRLQGRLDQAAEELEQSIELFRELKDTHNLARTLYGLASTLHLLDRYDECLEILDEALACTRESGTRIEEANVLSLKGVLLVKVGQYDQALHSQQSALALSREVGNRPGELSSLNSMCNVLQRMHRYDEARKFGLEALDASRELGERRTEANVLCSLGLVEWMQDKPLEATDYFDASLAIQCEIGNRAGQAAVLWNLGAAADDLRRYEEGVEFYRQSVDLYREIGNNLRVCSKQGFLAVRLVELGRPDEAEVCLQECKGLFKETDNHPAALMWYGHARALMAFRNGDLEEALDLNRRNLEYAYERKSSQLIATALSNIGLIRLEQGKQEEAREYMEKALEASGKMDYDGTDLAFAELHMMTGNKEAALKSAGKARARAVSMSDRKAQDRAEEILKDLNSHTTASRQN
jgi:class 3 adenylate cyclase/predicted ATPase